MAEVSRDSLLLDSMLRYGGLARLAGFSPELILGMAVIEGQIYKQKQVKSLPLLLFMSYGASNFAKNHPDFTRSCLIAHNIMSLFACGWSHNTTVKSGA